MFCMSDFIQVIFNDAETGPEQLKRPQVLQGRKRFGTLSQHTSHSCTRMTGMNWWKRSPIHLHALVPKILERLVIFVGFSYSESFFSGVTGRVYIALRCHSWHLLSP